MSRTGAVCLRFVDQFGNHWGVLGLVSPSQDGRPLGNRSAPATFHFLGGVPGMEMPAIRTASLAVQTVGKWVHQLQFTCDLKILSMRISRMGRWHQPYKPWSFCEPAEPGGAHRESFSTDAGSLQPQERQRFVLHGNLCKPCIGRGFPNHWAVVFGGSLIVTEPNRVMSLRIGTTHLDQSWGSDGKARTMRLSSVTPTSLAGLGYSR